MFARVFYLGYHPLGGDLEINGIKVMQAEWMKLRKPAVFAIGKSHDGISPAFCEAFYVKSEEKYAFFLAHENEIDKYHIFGFSDKDVNKLCAQVNKQHQAYHPANGEHEMMKTMSDINTYGHVESNEKMLAFKKALLKAGLKEAAYDHRQFHFYRYTTQKSAFVINLKAVDNYIRIIYGFTTIPEEDHFKNYGASEDDIKLRFKAAISNKGDEAIAKAAIENIYDTYSGYSKDEILAQKKQLQNEFLQKIAKRLKPLGFKKKGAKWTKALENDFVLEFEAQKSQWSDEYYFNVYVYHVNVKFPRCFDMRIATNGTQLYNWQLMSEEDIKCLLDNATDILTLIINTPLCELGNNDKLQRHCPGNKCDVCPADDGQAGGMLMSDIIAAHDYSANNKESLEKDTKCGCFYCAEIFDPAEITDFADNGKTALCPYCGIDSVIGESSGFPITKEFLNKMKAHWF